MNTQEQIKALIIPILKKRGVLYDKVLPVMARLAKEGEVIQTHTSDGLETENKAQKGDYIVKNQTEAGEAYIVKPKKFESRYKYLEELEGEWSLYQPTGKVWAIEVTKAFAVELDLELPFRFIASWDASMVVKENDFLVSQPNFSSVYRIARKEFFETYEKAEEV